MHQNRSISTLLTPFDHFQKRVFGRLISWHHLRPCRKHQLSSCLGTWVCFIDHHTRFTFRFCYPFLFLDFLVVNFPLELWNILLVFCPPFGSMSRLAIISPLKLLFAQIKCSSWSPWVRASQVIQAEEDIRRRRWLLAQIRVGKVSDILRNFQNYIY